MASLLNLPLLFLLLITTTTTSTHLEWPSTYTYYPYSNANGESGIVVADDDDEEEVMGGSRRAMFWHAVHFYISYGALSANRIPCPPRSGRSYYTHHCYRARGPVNPRTRGCSAITRCRI
ncbi:Protein RALF-like 34 [Acorus calamus]|uniref:Protein RALF-like 34 n=1 Tax=Acorus calamus TaxID=4465 RepID=A0AAV9DFE7_ACOCL|nr:Protein RALF-like 34 [Acorus calamus]